MTPMQTRLLSITAVVVFLAVFLLPDLLRVGNAPLKPGGQMMFGVTEITSQAQRSYPVRVYLHSRPGGYLELQVKAEHGEQFIKVDPQLRPQDMTDAIEFPLALSDEVFQPGALYLPSDERRLQTMSIAGMVRRITNYKNWKALEVEGIDGGSRYFDLDTGLLVGFDVRVGRRELVGSLMSIQ